MHVTARKSAWRTRGCSFCPEYHFMMFPTPLSPSLSPWQNQLFCLCCVEHEMSVESYVQGQDLYISYFSLWSSHTCMKSCVCLFVSVCICYCYCWYAEASAVPPACLSVSLFVYGWWKIVCLLFSQVKVTTRRMLIKKKDDGNWKKEGWFAFRRWQRDEKKIVKGNRMFDCPLGTFFKWE